MNQPHILVDMKEASSVVMKFIGTDKFDYAESIEYELLFKWFMCRKGHRKSRWKRKWARFFNRYARVRNTV